MKTEEGYIGCDIRKANVNEMYILCGNSFQTPSLDGLSIFLAEDEFINQHMISSFLEERGALVTICENGLALLRALEKSRPDVILTDINMPMMNGLEATRQIRESDRCRGREYIPIIALTAIETQGHNATCFTAGMDDYFTKPLDLDSLTAAILNLYNKREYLPI